MKTVLPGLMLVPALLAAQGAGAAKAPPLNAAQQIASAVLPLPTEFRADATVLGYRAGSGKLVSLRQGKGAFTCLASDPSQPRFHVACYHNSLEAFMARGRALREQGVKGDQVDTVRFAEIKSGKLAMPKQAAALYQLSGEPGSYDAGNNTIKDASALDVVYISGATSASTGLSARPGPGPWIMYPGTAKAHIMLTPKM
ncbi:MAG TPA: hypothetical protein VH277_10575 [Gemmatimonadaceae bacterium]|jgi:hypothetical protein|nr:hypothetical protein [Gemmatimonadaceae bacterium]